MEFVIRHIDLKIGISFSRHIWT